MHHIWIAELIRGAGLLLLLGAALHDFSFRTVPNWLSLALLALGLIWRAVEPDSGTFLWTAICGGAVFFITFLFWRFGLMGGGDVKLLVAATVFVPPAYVPILVTRTALAGGLLAMIYLLAGVAIRRPHRARPAGLAARVLRCEQWRLARRGPLPYAVAIASGGLAATLFV